MERRTCRYCKLTFDIEHYEIANIINGKKYHRWKCKKCYLETKNKRKNIIRSWLNDLKKGFQCQKCKIKDFRVIDFHHKTKNKSFCIANAIRFGISKEKILKEIEKCDALCANCHRILHYEERYG